VRDIHLGLWWHNTPPNLNTDCPSQSGLEQDSNEAKMTSWGTTSMKWGCGSRKKIQALTLKHQVTKTRTMQPSQTQLNHTTKDEVLTSMPPQEASRQLDQDADDGSEPD